MQTQRDFFSTREKRLIAFHSRLSPQMLIVDSRAYWQNDGRQQMTGFKQGRRGGWEAGEEEEEVGLWGWG